MQVTLTGTISWPWSILSAPLTFPAPTLGDLADAVARDLRDPEYQSFDAETVQDMIRLAFVEVGRVYPKETVEYILAVEDQYQYALTVEDPFRVEVYDAERNAELLPYGGGEGEVDRGWEFFGGTLYLVEGTSFDADEDEEVGDYLRVWGYIPRQPPTSTDDVCDIDGPAEQAIRSYCKLQAFESLVSDRSLFGQWASLPGNTDVSLGQTLQMVDIFRRQWEQRRRQLKLIRRVP